MSEQKTKTTRARVIAILSAELTAAKKHIAAFIEAMQKDPAEALRWSVESQFDAAAIVELYPHWIENFNNAKDGAVLTHIRQDWRALADRVLLIAPNSSGYGHVAMDYARSRVAMKALKSLECYDAELVDDLAVGAPE